MQAVAILLGVTVVILASILWELRGIRTGERIETPTQRIIAIAVTIAAMLVGVWTAIVVLRS
jgi:hypothetical protein